MIWKPTSKEKAVIRGYAEKVTGLTRVQLRPALRVGNRTGTDLNIRLISDDEEWNDTDLFDFRLWAFLANKGIELTPDGRGLVDVWVFSRRDYCSLEDQIQIVIEGGKLVGLTNSGRQHPDLDLTQARETQP